MSPETPDHEWKKGEAVFAEWYERKRKPYYPGGEIAEIDKAAAWAGFMEAWRMLAPPGLSLLRPSLPGPTVRGEASCPMGCGVTLVPCAGDAQALVCTRCYFVITDLPGTAAAPVAPDLEAALQFADDRKDSTIPKDRALNTLAAEVRRLRASQSPRPMKLKAVTRPASSSIPGFKFLGVYNEKGVNAGLSDTVPEAVADEVAFRINDFEAPSTKAAPTPQAFEDLVAYLEMQITSGRVTEIELTPNLLDLLAEARRCLVLPSAPSTPAPAPLDAGRDWFLLKIGERFLAFDVPQYNDGVKRDLIEGQIHVREVVGSPEVVPVLCACGHKGLEHRYSGPGGCLVMGCDCEEWRPRAALQAPAPSVDLAEIFEDYDSAMAQYERAAGDEARKIIWERVRGERAVVRDRILASGGEGSGGEGPSASLREPSALEVVDARSDMRAIAILLEKEGYGDMARTAMRIRDLIQEGPSPSSPSLPALGEAMRLLAETETMDHDGNCDALDWQTEKPCNCWKGKVKAAAAALAPSHPEIDRRAG